MLSVKPRHKSHETSGEPKTLTKDSKHSNRMAFFSYRLWYIDKIPFSGSSRNSKWYKTTSRPVQDVCLNNHMNNSSVGCLKYAQSRELLIFWMYISLSSPVALIPCVVLRISNRMGPRKIKD